MGRPHRRASGTGSHRRRAASVPRAADALADAGLEPSSLLRDAERAVLAGDVVRPAMTPASAAAAHVPAHERSVPASPPSSFVGRDHDRDSLVDLLRRARVVTLTGPGGVGKTRLALEVAHIGAERHALGAKVAELAPIVDGAAAADAIVHVLGLGSDAVTALEALDRGGRP